MQDVTPTPEGVTAAKKRVPALADVVVYEL